MLYLRYPYVEQIVDVVVFVVVVGIHRVKRVLSRFIIILRSV